jgi:hypothetical protein
MTIQMTVMPIELIPGLREARMTVNEDADRQVDAFASVVKLLHWSARTWLTNS